MSSKEEKKEAAEEAAARDSSDGGTHKDATLLTCDVLCSLSGSSPPHSEEACLEEVCEKKGKKGKGCPKQHQLPMFLSKTYHMIDRCDPEIATWSETGDNFVVKNVEKFSSAVLPQVRLSA